jgi:formate hydrogenlyase subunit 4
MNDLLKWLLLVVVIAVLPWLLVGTIRKTKATLQNRIGAPIYQPLMDAIKFLRKGELVSDSASWVLRGAAVCNAAVAILIAFCTPWIPGLPTAFTLDIFLLIYLFVVLRFFTVLGAMDTGSAFGGFGASREVSLAVLVEPAIMLCLASLALAAHSTELSTIFSYGAGNPARHSGLWAMAGFGLYITTLVELSRMPVDDPTTHLELTMVHEAMILENSGPNLALTEYCTALRMLILMGISGQCFLHALSVFWHIPHGLQIIVGLVSIFALVVTTALIETTAVKLRWTRVPEFIAYAVTFGLLCAVVAVGAPK